MDRASSLVVAPTKGNRRSFVAALLRMTGCSDGQPLHNAARAGDGGRDGMLAGSGGVGGGFGFGGLGHGGVVIEEAAAGVAGEELAVADLVPSLGADAHAAGAALLVFRAGHGGAAVGDEAVEAAEPVFVDGGAEGLALGAEVVLLGGDFALATGDKFAGFLEGSVHELDLAAGFGERGFLLVGALQALQFFVLQALDAAFGEGDLMLDGLGLGGGGHGVELGAIACGLLAVPGDVALEAGAEGFLAAEGSGGVGGGLLGLGQSGFSLGNFGGQGAGGLREAGPLEFERLQPDKIFNERNHG
jgi:hypothetical protein